MIHECPLLGIFTGIEPAPLSERCSKQNFTIADRVELVKDGIKLSVLSS